MIYEALYELNPALFDDFKGTKMRNENADFLRCILPFRKTRVFISRLGAFKIMQSGWI
jgi:hypothetical protein